MAGWRGRGSGAAGVWLRLYSGAADKTPPPPE